MFLPNRVEGIRFGILSPEEIKDISVCEITKPLTFENGKAISGGLNDLKMGPIERGEVCQSCWLDHYSCPGHFGHIDLVIPVLNVQFISNTRMGSSVSIKNILESICIKCGKLLIDIPDGIDKIHYKKRLAFIKNRIQKNTQKSVECASSTGCHYVQPNYSFGKYNECFYSYAGRESKERLRPEYILDLFSRIDNDTVRALGMDPDYCRPEWLIFTRLPVPPPALRPAIKSETAKHEDDLVVSFEQIIKINKQLSAALQQGNQKVLNWYEQLLNVYINSMISGKKVATGDSIVAFSTGGKPIKSIKDRLMNKDGRVRGNLSGKRVDYSGRTVITPDPTLWLDQIGIPLAICKTLTFPEIVTEDNVDKLYRYVYNGPNKYPGANSIIDVSGTELLLKHIDVSSVVLKPGDTVERHLIKDDIVLFNRQPSLHKMSMMSHRIVPLPESTFRMNVNACTQYNADFDGDEMNIHLPRSKVTQEELRMIALVPNQMISPAKSRSITGILQDGLSAIYKSTVHNVPMKAKRFYNTLLADDMFNGVVNIHKDGIYYGKDIFSHILPPLNYHKIEREPKHEFVKPLKDIIEQIKFNLFITYVDPEHISFQRVPDLQKKVSQQIKVFLGEYKKDKNVHPKIIETLEIIDKKLLTNKPRGLKSIVNNLEKMAKQDERKYTTSKLELDIVQGKLNYGKLGRSHFKSGGGDYNFIYRTWQDFGPLAARDLVTKVQKTMDYWLISDGHTIGMGDMLVHSKDVRDEITLAILKSLEAYRKLELDTIHGNLIPGIGRTIEDEFETQSMQIFNDAFSSKVPAILSKYLKTVPNHMHNMVASGAKGSAVNETQIMGLVGPIAIGGKRFPKSYGQRSLPHYQKYSNNATSRGFAANSFLNGLEPQEFFIQMASGREGCIDTAIKTAQSGYISRRLMKAMEDYMANYDCSVRNSMGRIIQFIYAGHGLDAVYCTHAKLTFIEQTYSNLVKNYLYTVDELKNTIDSEVLKLDKDNMKILEDDYNRIVYYQKLLREYIYRAHTESDVEFMSPINLDIELLNVKTNFGLMDIEDTDKSILDPVYVSRKINGLCTVIPQLYGNTSFNVDKNIPLISEFEWPRQDVNDPLDVNAFFKHLQKKNDNYYTVSLLFCIYIRSYLSPKRVITQYHLTKDAFDYLIDQIIYKYSRSIICPGEMVGSLAAQSIGEPTTQATLNSVDYKQRIIIGKKIGTSKDGKMILDIKEVPIGKFVESGLNYLKTKGINRTNNKYFQYFDYRKERQDQAEYGEILNMKYYTMSVNKEGKMRWNELTGISKHVPVNEDRSNRLLKVTLSNGSVIRATAGHSFLMRDPTGLVKKEGKTLKVGDLLPVMKDFPMDNIKELNYLDLTKYFPKNEYVWGTEMIKAEKIMREYNARGNRHWFSCNNGKLFTIPYSRSDIARCAFESFEFTHKEGYVYSKHFAGNCLPEKIKLDEDFGFFIGIYLAEGNFNGARRNKLMISNNDKRIRNKVERFVKQFGINCHTQTQNDKIKEGWTSISIIIHSAILTKLIIKICGEYSDGKFVAPFIYNSNIEFIKGVLSGYFSGDGCVHNKQYLVTATSVSKKLLKGMGILLNRIGCFYKLKTPKRITKNNRGTLPENIKQHYTLHIYGPNAVRLLNNIKIIKNYTDDRIDLLKSKKYNYKFSIDDIIPDVKIGNDIVNINRDELLKYSELKDIYESNVCYYPIVNIDYVKPSNGFTYDITVHDDHTFVTNGMAVHQTFHLSGVAAKSSVLSGIPRMEELFRVTKKIKTPMMDVFLDSSIMDNKYQAKIIANSIEHTVLLSFAKNIGIWFDPIPNNTVVEEDKAFVKAYFDNTIGLSNINLDRLSKFMIRVELDKHKTIYKQIRMNFLKHQLQKYKNGYFFIIHSDDNADKLILHIRMNLDNVTTKYSDELDLVRKSKDLVMEKIEIRGVKNIMSAQIDNAGEKVYVYDPDTGKREQKDQWIIYTDGTNLKYTLGQPGVDSNKIVTTDVYEVSQILGIEAGRTMLFREFNDTYTQAVTTINYHHLSILVDIMTYNGHLMPISRHGINRTDNSPLTKASFEETQEQLAEAGIYGVLDNMKSVSACTMIAQTTRSGTCGPFDIIYDYHNKGITSDDLDFLLEQETKITGDELDVRID